MTYYITSYEINLTDDYFTILYEPNSGISDRISRSDIKLLIDSIFRLDWKSVTVDYLPDNHHFRLVYYVNSNDLYVISGRTKWNISLEPRNDKYLLYKYDIINLINTKLW